MKLINENAPKAVKEQQMENYFARKVAIDASMSLYQFLVRHTTEGQRRARLAARCSAVAESSVAHSSAILFLRLLSAAFVARFKFAAVPRAKC